jgi:hypothetical protein
VGAVAVLPALRESEDDLKSIAIKKPVSLSDGLFLEIMSLKSIRLFIFIALS